MTQRHKTARPPSGARSISILVHRLRTQFPIVGVIGSRDDLRFALKMADPPDFLELRLDCLIDVLDELENSIARLRAPLIITARHPREGGAHRLSPKQRRHLLLRFLPGAQYLDVELRSARSLQSLLDLARKKKVRRIISLHDFSSTPTLRSLHNKARLAKSCGADIFKVATRTDTPAQLARLVEFVANKDVAETRRGGQLLQQKSRTGRGEANRRSWTTQPIGTIGCPAGEKRADLATGRVRPTGGLAVSAMGIGKLGGISRILLAQCGSALNYVSLGRSQIEGQLSIQQLRSALAR